MTNRELTQGVEPSSAPSAPAPYVRDGFIMTRIVNPVVASLHLGTILMVKGRKTGRTIEIPLGAPLELEGERYLVAGRGNTNWARNLRAAGSGALRSHGHVEDFQAIELTGADRDRIILAYRKRLGRLVEGMFRQIPDPADHPVFLIRSRGTRTASSR